MYGICLMAALVSGDAAPAYWHSDVEDLKRSIESLRKEQEEQRIEALKLKIAQLMQENIEQRLDGIRKDVEELKYGAFPPAHAWPAPAATVLPYPMPSASVLPRSIPAAGNRATIQLELPVDAALFVDGRPIVLTSPRTTFVTPPLPEGKSYFYTFKVEVPRGEKQESRTKKVSVRPGAFIRLTYEDMAGGPPPAPPAPPVPPRDE